MAHNEIYKRFMIEYDKANVTSSYPSLTKHEIAIILNKAYLALIAQKVTGNNPRQASFEADPKAVSDIQPLVVTGSMSAGGAHSSAINSACYTLPSDFLYYVSGVVNLDGHNSTVELVSHQIAQKFKQTISNRPWIKESVAFIEDNKVVVLYDNYQPTVRGIVRVPGSFTITYVKEPSMFTDQFDGNFELNDTMAEELISLAVIIALENVESTRLTTKVQTRGLEA